jgi:aminomethyltransferase
MGARRAASKTSNKGNGLGTSSGTALRRTALYSSHRAAGARMVEFGGWEMPVEYSGIIQEHLAVRTRAGLFDVGHMGEIELRGPRALTLLQRVTCNDASRLSILQAQYSALMLANGACVDDCVVHRLGEDHFFLCVNAANTARDFAYLASQNNFSAAEVDLRDVSADYAQIALQGPAAAAILGRLTTYALESLKYYWCCHAECCGVPGLLARTGYTGEDGFEFYLPPRDAPRVWAEMLEAGRAEGLIPAGLGARNTLRLEASYPLYGHELDEQTTLLEAGLGWICKLQKGEFVGRQALLQQKENGAAKKLVGFEMTAPGIGRDGYPVWIKGEKLGVVTSGSFAPFLKKSIGMAYVKPALAQPGLAMEIEIRGRKAQAVQVPLPFYKRARN